jgi:predicted nucleotidyltransferase component of viral defense system
MTLEIAVPRKTLIFILSDIYTNLKLAPLLGLKGETAAYLFYDLGRFSVDLDFDILDAKQENLIFEKLEGILKKYGSLIEGRKKRFSLFYLLSYENKIQDAYNVKVEVNRRDFGSRYEMKSYLGIPIKVMTREDMAAHKLVAMF